jgi:hypothetical protein
MQPTTTTPVGLNQTSPPTRGGRWDTQYAKHAKRMIPNDIVVVGLSEWP